MPTKSRIAVLYEHPEWFKRLFETLAAEDISFDALCLRDQTYDPSILKGSYALVVNRMSAQPSNHSHPEIVFYVRDFLAYLEAIEASVLNGFHSYIVGGSKALQTNIFSQLGLKYPRTAVINHPHQALAVAKRFLFPVLVKPNIGGSGTGITKFSSFDELETTVNENKLSLGIDHVGLLQEFLPVRDSVIYRVEILNDKLLYSLTVPLSNESFNYCPADGCNIERNETHQNEFAFCAADLGSRKIESWTAPQQIVDQAREIMRRSRTEIGSVEFLINDSDGEPYFYDINPLSNFVANAPEVVGFDPYKPFITYIKQRAGIA